MGNGRLAGLVLLDLRKALDTVDHGIMLDKLQAMGVSNTSWFKSYLSDRFQCVDVDGVRSSFLGVTCGVPQGSILGPLLFLVYINDMHRSVTCRLSLYADDSALIFSHSDHAVIAERLSIELSSCQKWLIDNRLSLHVGKTECIIFGSGRRLKETGNFAVSCDGMSVDQVAKVKYLGVTLDQAFKFSEHVTGLINRCAGRVGFLYRNSSFLDFECRKIMCNSLIQPYLDYCCSTWYSSISKHLRDRLDVIQRRMVRFVLSKDPLYHVSPQDLAKLSWLSIPDRVKFYQLNHVFKIRLGNAPKYLSASFQPVTQRHSHDTRRSSCDYFVSKELANSPRSFAFTAIKHWNGLPRNLKEIEKFEAFKTRLKEYLFASY